MAQERDPRAPGGTLPAWQTPAPLESAERPRAQALAPTQPASAVPIGDPLPLAVGSIIAERYVIEQLISGGGFGAVYRASDREIRHHQVALKLLHRGSASEAERQSALRELMLIASVSHPSVVQFKDYGWHEGRLWFAMPWYQGKTLDRVLGSGEGAVAMSRAEARPIFTRVAQGLAAMHAVGIHHHDIKPENIFLAEIAGFPGGLPVLLDLGISTRRGENPQGLTVEYASPETAAAMLGEGDRPIGAAADVFSLALVLRNALDPSAATSLVSDNVIPALHQRATQPVGLPTTRELRYLDAPFRRWLSLDPDERPSAAELADQLAVLTAPEERRQARLRLLKRIVPVVLIAGLMIALLVLQLRRTKTELTEQGKELEQEREASEELRKQSEDQLGALEQAAQTIGNERAQLDQALALGHKLNVQVAKANKKADQLGRTVAELTRERDDLVSQKLTLTEQRDGLLQDKVRLTAERDALRAERDRLNGETAQLSRERTDLDRERLRLASERDALGKQVETLTTQRDALDKERAAAVDRAELATRKLDEASARQAELERQLERLAAEKERLQQRVTELEQATTAADDSPGAKQKTPTVGAEAP